MKKNLPITGVNKDVNKQHKLLSTTDLKGAITYVNPDFLDICGFDEHELLGENHNMVRHPDMPPAAFENMWRNISAGKPWMGVVKNRCKNGDHYWVDAYVMPIQKDGKTIEYQSVRLKADDEATKRAKPLYKRLLEKKKTPRKLLTKISLQNKLIAANTFALLPIISALILQAEPLFVLQTCLISVVLMVLSNNWLMKPFSKLTKQAKSIYDNPLMSHIYTGREDEFGHIQLALKMQSSQIDSMVGRLSDSTRVLSDVSAKNASNSKQIHQGALAQHYELTQVANAMNSMAKTVHEVASSAADASNSTDMGLNEATKGKRVVNTAITSINKLVEEIQNAAAVIEELSQYSTNIGDMLNVIKGIAEQTNLLALNAAIEAARAGEHGRGFAVVADEVRVLASRTQDSAQEIESVIEQLQKRIKQAVRVMDGSCKQADISVSKAQKVSDALESITSAVSVAGELNQRIASASDVQSTVAHNIDKNILNISDTANEASRGAEVNVQSSDKMSSTIQSLNNLITQFTNKEPSSTTGLTKPVSDQELTKSSAV